MNGIVSGRNGPNYSSTHLSMHLFHQCMYAGVAKSMFGLFLKVVKTEGCLLVPRLCRNTYKQDFELPGSLATISCTHVSYVLKL